MGGIEQATTKHCVEYAVSIDIPHVVLRELEVRQIRTRLHVPTRGDVGFADVNPKRLKTHPDKLHGVAAFETSKVCDAKVAFRTGKHGVKNPFGRKKPGMPVHGICKLRLGEASIVQANVVGTELYSHLKRSHSSTKRR